jgi:hypothetical protein
MSELPLFEQNGHDEPRLVGPRSFAAGAQFCDDQWRATVVSKNRALFPYRRFVKATLSELGYDVLA